MRHFNSAIFLIAILFTTAFVASAQETELKVVDEVVAQVNDSVVTLSGIRREMKEVVMTLREQGKTEAEATAEVESKKAELIAGIINQELLMQKGKELGVETEVEAELNRRLREKMQQLNLKTVDKLYEMMRASNLDPDQVRQMWREDITRDLVLQREVDGKVYYGWTAAEIKAYYEKNKAKFFKPETITISEIFLSFAGVERDAVIAKANDLVKQLRAGADFGKLAVENSERPDIQQTKGKVGTFTLEQIKAVNDKLAQPIQATKAGSITDPIVLDEGIEIFRVDERIAASSDAVFDENEVRRVMTYEKLPAERQQYLTKLRQEAYIKINSTYRPMIAPLLFAEERKTEEKKTDEKKSNK